MSSVYSQGRVSSLGGGSASGGYHHLTATPFDNYSGGGGNPLDYITSSSNPSNNPALAATADNGVGPTSALPYSSTPPIGWTTFDGVQGYQMTNRGNGSMSSSAALSSHAEQGAPNYSMEQAASESHEQRFHSTELWKPTLFYKYRTLSRYNILNITVSIGFVWTCIVSFVCWLWLIGAWSTDNTSRQVFIDISFIFTVIWGVVMLGCAIFHLKDHKMLTNRHKIMVLAPFVVMWVVLVLGLIAMTISNHKYTNIADFINGEESKEQKEKNKLELSNGHHWCDDEKVQAGLSFYVSLTLLSLAAFFTLPWQALSWAAHVNPECTTNVVDFYDRVEDYADEQQQQQRRKRKGGSRKTLL